MRFLFFVKNRVLHLSSPRPLYEARFDDTLRNNHYLTTYCGIDDLVNSHVGEIILGHHLFISVKRDRSEPSPGQQQIKSPAAAKPIQENRREKQNRDRTGVLSQPTPSGRITPRRKLAVGRTKSGHGNQPESPAREDSYAGTCPSNSTLGRERIDEEIRAEEIAGTAGCAREQETNTERDRFWRCESKTGEENFDEEARSKRKSCSDENLSAGDAL
jgi:hypothetical protein